MTAIKLWELFKQEFPKFAPDVASYKGGGFDLDMKLKDGSNLTFSVDKKTYTLQFERRIKR